MDMSSGAVDDRRRDRITSLARETKQPFGSAPIASNPGDTVVQISTLQVPNDHFPQIGPPETIVLLKSVLVNMLEGLAVVLSVWVKP
jgi:hypothetical protein